MSLSDVHQRAEALLSHTCELAQDLSRCRAELYGLALELECTPAGVTADLRDLDDLLHIMDELRQAVETRVAHLQEEIVELREEGTETVPGGRVPERVQRYLAFAGQAGIAPPPLN